MVGLFVDYLHAATAFAVGNDAYLCTDAFVQFFFVAGEGMATGDLLKVDVGIEIVLLGVSVRDGSPVARQCVALLEALRR